MVEFSSCDRVKLGCFFLFLVGRCCGKKGMRWDVALKFSCSVTVRVKCGMLHEGISFLIN